MRVLVLGGTSFLSKTVAAEAVRRGHEVVCAARGVSGSVPDGARHVRVDRDEPGSIDVLAGERFDAVVDIAYTGLRWVRDALRTITTRHWTYVSTINTYADTSTLGQTAEAPQHEPIERDRIDLAEMTPEVYGGVQVACEHAARDALGDRLFIVRPGQITGPGDYMDRFGYWPARFSRGGRVVVPDTPKQPFQHVDVRDLAAWIVTAGEQRLTGAFDAVSPVAPLGPVLEEIADLVAPPGTELVPVTEETLTAAGVQPWFGPKSLPLWLPASHHGLAAHDASAAQAAGLEIRPLADTVLAALDEERARGLDRPRKAGLTPDEEAALIRD
ncbi:NAD-dependent epimerase/dehydratase family protein [Amycolatopsis thermoflava]|uniref:NAD-dependent epimerase/dehydratase family protein n=1 Tax=Amycolatopsis thermoflava TaxID=84480 RepID=UPI0036564EE9